MTERHRMRLLARHDLAGRGNGGEGIALHQSADGRRTLYIAHESAPVDISIVDVTTPDEPQLIKQIDLPHARVRSNSLAAANGILCIAYQVAEVGLAPAGLGIFSLDDPYQPRQIGFWDCRGPHSRGVHCVWFVDGRYAYVSTGTKDSRPTHPNDDQFPVILDLIDPANPVEVGRWWLPGTQEGDNAELPQRLPGLDIGHRSHNVNVYPQCPDRAYVGYFDSGLIILDISDKANPKLISQLNNHPPFKGLTHTVVPLVDRGLLAVTDEAVVDGAGDYPKFLWLADASYEEKPVLISTAPLPPLAEHAQRGGRFGAHNIHENEPVPTAWFSERYLVGAFFNAGVRVFDTADPYHPREIAFYVPEPPAGSPVGAIQINDVWVDENRIVYAVDRLTGGLYILEFDLDD